MRKVPKWLKEYFDEPTEENEVKALPDKFGHDASVQGTINGKKVTVWYKKWYDNILYQYKVNDYRRSPQILQAALEIRLKVIKGKTITIKEEPNND